MKVKDLQERKELELITNSQDIESIAVMIGVNPLSFGCLFVELIDGEFGDVYGCYSNIPYLHYEVEKIH
jgi:hypothetical protein